MTRSIFAFCIAYTLVGGFAARVAQADDKIAYVDLQRALEETKDGQAAKARLKADFDKKQKELDARQNEIKKEKDDFDKQSAMLKEDAKNKKAAELQQKVVALQETYMRLQKELGEKEQEATRGILGKLQQVVAKIAERDHFALVLERSSSVVYGQPSLDLTAEVIRAYNAQSGGGGTPKK
jgi:outer membrane protein